MRAYVVVSVCFAEKGHECMGVIECVSVCVCVCVLLLFCVSIAESVDVQVCVPYMCTRECRM